MTQRLLLLLLSLTCVWSSDEGLPEWILTTPEASTDDGVLDFVSLTESDWSSSESAVINPLLAAYDLGKAARSDRSPHVTQRGFSNIHGSTYFNGELCLLILRRAQYITCITTDAVDRAVLTVLGGPSEDELPRPPLVENISDKYISQIAVIVLKVTKALATHYKIPPHLIHKTFPLVDTTTTLIYKMCPAYLKPKFKDTCSPTQKYRSINGLCNNPQHPHWGSSFSPFQREMPANYPDAIECPTGLINCDYSFDGVNNYNSKSRLPEPREISLRVHTDNNRDDYFLTMAAVAFAQLVDHDVTGTAPTIDPYAPDGVLNCCRNYSTPHRDCFPIRVSLFDPLYSTGNRTCLNFARSKPTLAYGCRMGSRNCINGVTHFLDGSYIYGSHEHKEKELIARTNGEMRMWYKFKYRKPLLPQTTKESHECLPLEEHHKCFNGGDVRANEQPTLLVLHTIGTRYHNSVAKALRAYNPHWDDQKTYEEARRIVVAVFQHIVYKEFLPIILGWETIHRYGLGLETAGYYYGYNPSENSNILIGFMTAAFRFGHTLLPDHLDLYNSYHNRIGSVKLVDQLNQPWLLMEEKNFDRFVLGMINQKTSKYDASVIDEVRGTLFKKPNETLGHDLVTLNIQRGRDHGLQSYTRYRDWCGLRPVHSWYDLHGLMPNHTISAFKSLYKYVDDIELFSAGISEFNLPNSVLGETFACIIARQFKALRDGDRFWYENAGQPSSFTPDQLYEIRQMSFARIMCDETDDVVTIQRNVFLQPDPFSNPRIPCANYIALPKLNFAPWKELPGDIPVASATGYYSPPPVVAYDLRHVIHP